MKVKLWVFTEDGGDGSVMPHFFNTREDMQAYADKVNGIYGQTLCEDTFPIDFEFDVEGNLLNPSVIKDLDWHDDDS